jgi:NitT/TauT family transport system permease protein
MSSTTDLPAAPARPAKPGYWSDGIPQPVAVAMLVGGIIAAWWAAITIGGISQIILPSPAQVAGQIWIVLANVFTGDYLLEHVLVTAQEVLLGFTFATIVGITVGAWIGLTKFGQRAAMPLFVVLEATPKIAFAPLFVAWFGFGMTSKIVMATFVSLFPIIVSTAAGLGAAEELEQRLFRSMRASPWQVFWKLKIYRAMPFIFSGLKIASVSAVTGAVAAELLGGGTGVGEQIRVAATRLAIDRVFGLIVLLSVFGLGLFSIVTLIERRVVFWQGASRRTRRAVPAQASQS